MLTPRPMAELEQRTSPVTMMARRREAAPARTLHAIGILARLAPCDCCPASGPTVPCVQSRTGPEGLHVARFAAARRRGLITAADFALVITAAGAFTSSTVVYDDAFGDAAGRTA